MNSFIRTSIFSLLYLLFSCIGYSQNTQYFELLPSVYEGSTVVEQVYSPALEGNLQGNPSTQPVKIYLPPNYDDYPDNEYPVVYLLHGYMQNYNTYYDQWGILNKLNQLMSQKTIVPMIIVTPNGKTIYDGSMYTNSYVSGNWEDFIVWDVIQHIENKYHVLDQKESRGLAGFSMGAKRTAVIGMKHPSLFNSIGMIGGGGLHFETAYLNNRN